jgi:hypothetical protein
MPIEAKRDLAVRDSKYKERGEERRCTKEVHTLQLKRALTGHTLSVISLRKYLKSMN